MNNLSQPQPDEPDMALLYLGSLFETLHDIPEREDATLNALAGLILEEGPKTLLGLAIACRGEKWLRRQLWMVDFNILSPSDQAARVVIDSAMRIDCAQVLPSQEPADKRIASELLAGRPLRSRFDGWLDGEGPD
jgi:hypothetical protein